MPRRRTDWHLCSTMATVVVFQAVPESVPAPMAKVRAGGPDTVTPILEPAFAHRYNVCVPCGTLPVGPSGIRNDDKVAVPTCPPSYKRNLAENPLSPTVCVSRHCIHGIGGSFAAGPECSPIEVNALFQSVELRRVLKPGELPSHTDINYVAFVRGDGAIQPLDGVGFVP